MSFLINSFSFPLLKFFFFVLFYQVFIQPLTEQKKRLILLLIALISLSLIQVIFALFLDPLMRSLFLPGTNETFSITEILPSKVSFLGKYFFNFQLNLTSLPYIVSISLLLMGLIRSYFLFTYQLNSTALSLWVGKYYREKLFENG